MGNRKGNSPRERRDGKFSLSERHSSLPRERPARRRQCAPQGLQQITPRTTIVGARPPGSGEGPGDVPRGIEVLIKKASVDAEFKKLLTDKRSGAAEEIQLRLDPAEVAMLNSVPASQLEAIIARTKVSWKSRAAFLGRAAAVMLAALGTATLTTGCGTKGHDADRSELAKKEMEAPADEDSGPQPGGGGV